MDATPRRPDGPSVEEKRRALSVKVDARGAEWRLRLAAGHPLPPLARLSLADRLVLASEGLSGESFDDVAAEVEAAVR